jgi:membrane protease YdiL (CAAX protease family)
MPNMTSIPEIVRAGLPGLTFATRGLDSPESQLLNVAPTVMFTLLFLGLVADVFVYLRFVNSPRANPDGSPATFRVDAKPWSLAEIALAIAALIAGLLIADALLMLAAIGLAGADHAPPTLRIAGQLVVEILFVIGVVVWLRYRRHDLRAAFGLRRGTHAGAILDGLLCFLAVLPPLAVGFVVWLTLLKSLGIEYTPQPVAELLAGEASVPLLVLLVVFAAVVAPLCEELVFRGLLYPLAKRWLGTALALLATSAVFALIHVHLPTMGALFVLGIGLGLAYELTGSVLTPISMHAAFNGINLAGMLMHRATS